MARSLSVRWYGNFDRDGGDIHAERPRTWAASHDLCTGAGDIGALDSPCGTSVLNGGLHDQKSRHYFAVCHTWGSIVDAYESARVSVNFSMIGAWIELEQAAQILTFASSYVGHQNTARSSYCLIIVVGKSMVTSFQLLRSRQERTSDPTSEQCWVVSDNGSY